MFAMKKLEDPQSSWKDLYCSMLSLSAVIKNYENPILYLVFRYKNYTRIYDDKGLIILDEYRNNYYPHLTNNYFYNNKKFHGTHIKPFPFNNLSE